MPMYFGGSSVNSEKYISMPMYFGGIADKVSLIIDGKNGGIFNSS
jgi:hypothetical protein